MSSTRYRCFDTCYCSIGYLLLQYRVRCPPGRTVNRTTLLRSRWLPVSPPKRARSPITTASPPLARPPWASALPRPTRSSPSCNSARASAEAGSQHPHKDKLSNSARGSCSKGPSPHATAPGSYARRTQRSVLCCTTTATQWHRSKHWRRQGPFPANNNRARSLSPCIGCKTYAQHIHI